MKHAVLLTGGKQYIIEKGQTLMVDLLPTEAGKEVALPTVLSFDEEAVSSTKRGEATVKVIEHLRGDKVRVSKFKSKVRYHKVRGFRQELSKIEVISLA